MGRILPANVGEDPPAELRAQTPHPPLGRIPAPTVDESYGHAWRQFQRHFWCALAGQGSLVATTVLHVDLTSGAAGRLLALPGVGLGLAATDERLYVPHPDGDRLWVVDRRRGRLMRVVPVGRRPTAIVPAGASR
jgi:hypothetical protein